MKRIKKWCAHFSAFFKLLLLAAVKTLHCRLKSFCWLYSGENHCTESYLTYDSKSVKLEPKSDQTPAEDLGWWAGKRNGWLDSRRKTLPTESKSFNQELPMQGKWVLNKTKKEKKETASALTGGCCLITAQKSLSFRNFKVLIPSNTFKSVCSPPSLARRVKFLFPFGVLSVPVASKMKLFFLTLLEMGWIIDHNYAAWQERWRKQPHLLPGSLRGLLRQF